MNVRKLKTPKWVKKTVQVTGIGTMSADMLEVLYETKTTSGGGPVERIHVLPGNTTALVKFMNESDADQVLHQGVVKQADGSTIRASKPNDMNDGKTADQLNKCDVTPSVSSNSIMVLGINENITVDNLEMLFENESESSGDTVEKISIDQEFGIAVVTFSNPNLAQKVLAGRNLEYQNVNLTLLPHVTGSLPQIPKRAGGVTMSHQKSIARYNAKYSKFNADQVLHPDDVKPKDCTMIKAGEPTDIIGETADQTNKCEATPSVSSNSIMVLGINESVTVDSLEMLFENESKSVSGSVEKISLDQEFGLAVVTFSKPNATKRILQRHKDTPLSIEDCRLQLKPIDSGLYGLILPSHIPVTGSEELPKCWSPMSKDQRFTLVNITRGSPEYNTVEKSFQTSFRQGGATQSKTVLKIQRVQNPSMYKKYMVHKVQLDNSNPQAIVNERTLWHGTTEDILTEIHTNGFNRSFSGKNGAAYGRGVYFATYANLSDGYAKPTVTGQRYMYQCKVLAGEFTEGNSSLIVPPAKYPRIPSLKFDSVVDNVPNPRIIVVFQDNQAYPEYLIMYQ